MFLFLLELLNKDVFPVGVKHFTPKYLKLKKREKKLWSKFEPKISKDRKNIIDAFQIIDILKFTRQEG